MININLPADNLIYIFGLHIPAIRCPNQRKKKVPQDKIFRKYQGNSVYIEIRDLKMATTCSKRVKKKRIAEKNFIFISFYFSFTDFNNIDYWGKIIRF